MKFNSLFEKENRKKMGDLFLNIGATALFNLVIQFALYPYLNKTLGTGLRFLCSLSSP